MTEITEDQARFYVDARLDREVKATLEITLSIGEWRLLLAELGQSPGWVSGTVKKLIEDRVEAVTSATKELQEKLGKHPGYGRF